MKSPPNHNKSIGTSQQNRLRRANSPPSGDGADPRQEKADRGQKPADIVKVFHDWLQYFMKVNQFKNARGSQQFEAELNARKRQTMRRVSSMSLASPLEDVAEHS